MSDISEVSIYPLDCEALEKGSYITPAEVEQITGVSRFDAQYSLKALNLCTFITGALKERNIDVVVRRVDFGIKICLDNEASEYTLKRCERGLREIGRNLRRMLSIDKNNLTPDECTMHDARVNVVSRYYQSARKARLSGIKEFPAMLPDRPNRLPTQET